MTDAERARRIDVETGRSTPRACAWCASPRIHPFVPARDGVDYRCRDCGYRWLVRVDEGIPPEESHV